VNRIGKYLVALGMVGLAIAIRAVLNPWLSGTLTHPTVFLAVLLSAWYCGTGPALLCTAIGYWGIEHFALHTPFEGWLNVQHIIAQLALYGGMNAVIIFIVAQHRGEHRRLSQALVERERVESALRESEERYRSFVDASAQVVWTTDATGQVVMDIPAWQAYTGQSPDEARGFGWMNAILAEDRARVAEAWRRAFDTRSLYEVEYLVKRYDGEWRNVLARGVPIKDRDGSVREYIGTCIDITERRRAEEELRRSEEQLRVATLAAEIGVWSWVPGTDDLVVSANWRRLFGVPEQVPVTLQTWRDALHPEDRQLAVQDLYDASQKRREFNTEYRILCPDGTVRWVVDRGRAWYDETGRAGGMAGINIDITERKRLEDRLRATTISAEQAKATAEHANRAKDEFLAVLSHELRTPLSPILAAVQLIQLQTGLDDDMRNHLEVIRRNLELEARLIDDLLDLTRIVRGKIEIERRPLKIGTVVERVIDICRPDIEARKLHFDLEMGDPAIQVQGDASRLQQVFWNVLKNAIKFTPDGGRVAVRLNREHDSAVIEVNDSGIGIEPASLGRIFNAFEQEDRGITRQFGGLGLGLAITRRLLEMHGGSIEAHSRGKGEGATFRIVLPVDRSEAPSAADTHRPARQSSARRILLVEDHSDTALMMRLLLENSGYEVETAGDLKQALNAASSMEFDLIISDLGLPDGSGLDLIRELRRRGSTLKAIALSGYGREEDIKRSESAGFNAHLTKPVAVDALVQMVESIL
jgi:PAS domain S-box-containing protein